MSDNIIPFRRRDEAPKADAPVPKDTAPEPDGEWTVQIVAKAPPKSR